MLISERFLRNVVQWSCRPAWLSGGGGAARADSTLVCCSLRHPHVRIVSVSLQLRAGSDCGSGRRPRHAAGRWRRVPPHQNGYLREYLHNRGGVIASGRPPPGCLCVVRLRSPPTFNPSVAKPSTARFGATPHSSNHAPGMRNVLTGSSHFDCGGPPESGVLAADSARHTEAMLEEGPPPGRAWGGGAWKLGLLAATWDLNGRRRSEARMCSVDRER